MLYNGERSKTYEVLDILKDLYYSCIPKYQTFKFLVIAQQIIKLNFVFWSDLNLFKHHRKLQELLTLSKMLSIGYQHAITTS